MMDDVDRIMAVMTSAFDPLYREAWTRRQVEDALAIGNSHYQLAGPQCKHPFSEPVAAGFTLSRGGFEEEELLLIGVCPEFRNKGIGKYLLERLREDAAMRGARRLLLEMRRSNPAESLYRNFGFYPIGTRRDYYRTTTGDLIDAITFAYDIV